MANVDARRLTEIRERLERATKAPWIVNVWTSGRYTVENGNGLAIAEVHPVHEEGGQRANAHLLANAPADIRDLLERVEKLEADLDVANDALKTAAVLLKGKN